MEVVISVCVVIVTVLFILVAIEVIDTLKKVREAIDSISKVAMNLNEIVENTKPAFKGVRVISDGITTIVNNILYKLLNLFKKG
ncbi:MAG: hypothetical protein N2446_01590 [Elusimicrobiales bacterium]|nr:hypothetical protein [Elusimicrobiales bacterium]